MLTAIDSCIEITVSFRFDAGRNMAAVSLERAGKGAEKRRHDCITAEHDVGHALTARAEASGAPLYCENLPPMGG
jgi:hypothetical protein